MSDILIVDDERDIRELIADILKDEGFETRLAANSDEAVEALNSAEPALMVLDIWLKDSRMDGIDILKQVKRNNPDVPVIIISGHGNIEIAVAAIKQGAYDFIEKPFNIDQLMVVVNRAMETSRLRRENSTLRRGGERLAEMLGQSAAFKRLRDNLDKVAKSNGRNPAPARNWPRAMSMLTARGPMPLSSPCPAPASSPSGWKRCCSAARRQSAASSPDCWNRHMAASSISTRLATCRLAPSRRSCVS